MKRATRASERRKPRSYAPLIYDHEETVVHIEKSVTDDGVHINQVEHLWPLLNPWLPKFRDLFKPDWSSPCEPGVVCVRSEYSFGKDAASTEENNRPVMENDMRTFKCCTDQFGFVRTLNLIGAALHSLIHAVSDDFDISEQGADAWARAFYADADPEIRAVLEAKE